MSIDITPGRRADIKEMSATLARAFHDDPVMMWMLPDDQARTRGLPRMFATLIRFHFLAGGGVEVARRDGTIGAATLWDPPGRWKPSRLEQVLMMPGFIMAFGSRAEVGQQVSDIMKAHHPGEPHWYLNVIGSDPTVRGAGLGHALMRSRIDRIDDEHAPAYLESTRPDNVPYYKRFGFEVTTEIELPDGGPTMWPMWRRPR